MKKCYSFFTIGLICFLATNLTSQNLVKELTNELTQHFEKSDLPGFAVAVVKENEVLYQQGFGYANKQTKTPFTINTAQNIGSVTKTLVGVAIVKAIEVGKLSMDTKINEILPFEIHNPYFKNEPITVRQLVTHTSSILNTKFYGNTYVAAANQPPVANMHEDFLGFIRSHEKMELGAFLKAILHKNGQWYKKKNFLKAKSGTAKEYSNLNAALAAYLVEVVMEMPFDEHTTKVILQPLEMTNSGWKQAEVDEKNKATLYFPRGQVVPNYTLNSYPDGGLLTTVKDLSLYLQAIIKAYNGQEDFLSQKATGLLLPGDKDAERAFFGIGKESRNIGHGGSDPGVQTDMQFNADSKIGRIIFTNVNAEDNEELWEQYRGIHEILAKYEAKWKTHP